MCVTGVEGHEQLIAQKLAWSHTGHQATPRISIANHCVDLILQGKSGRHMERARRLIIVGGGPAGCSAAVMADTLGIESLLVEQGQVARSVEAIPNLENILDYEDGPAIASAFRRKMQRLKKCRIHEGAKVSKIKSADCGVGISLSDGSQVEGSYCIVATGLRQAEFGESSWIKSGKANQALIKSFWDLPEESLNSPDPLLVLGADRQLGTFLRTLPRSPIRIIVLHSQAEAYLMSEVASDPRVESHPVERVELRYDTSGVSVHWNAGAGDETSCHTTRIINNLGRVPSGLTGLVVDKAGYAPPDLQNIGFLTAGDIRGPRFQRIAIAIGSGAEAALKLYYRDAGVLLREH